MATETSQTRRRPVRRYLLNLPDIPMAKILQYLDPQDKLALETTGTRMLNLVTTLGWKFTDDLVIRVDDHDRKVHLGLGQKGQTQFEVSPTKVEAGVRKLLKIASEYGPSRTGIVTVTFDHDPCLNLSCTKEAHDHFAINDRQADKLIGLVAAGVAPNTLEHVIVDGKFTESYETYDLLNSHNMSITNVDFSCDCRIITRNSRLGGVDFMQLLPNLEVLYMRLPQGTDRTDMLHSVERRVAVLTCAKPELQILRLGNLQVAKASTVPKMIANSCGALKIVRIDLTPNGVRKLNRMFENAVNKETWYSKDFAKNAQNIKMLIVEMETEVDGIAHADPIECISKAFAAVPSLVTFRMENYEGYKDEDGELLSDGTDIKIDVVAAIETILSRKHGTNPETGLIGFVNSVLLGKMDWLPVKKELQKKGLKVEAQKWPEMVRRDCRLHRFLEINDGSQKLAMFGVSNGTDDTYVVHPVSAMLSEGEKWDPLS